MVPGNVHHRYDDKYTLAEAQVSSLVAGTLQGLQAMGMTPEQLVTISAWAREDSEVTLRFSSSSNCSLLRESSNLSPFIFKYFLAPPSYPHKHTHTRPYIKMHTGKETREEETDGNALVVSEEASSSTSVGLTTNSVKTTTSFVVTEVTDYIWLSTASWKLVAFKGTGRSPGEILLISSRDTASVELKTGSEACPFPGSSGSLDTPLTWLLKQVDGSGKSRLTIDRTHKECHTPRRNAQVEAAFAQAKGLFHFFSQLEATIKLTLTPVEMASRASGASPSLCSVSLDASDLFVAGILFEGGGGGGCHHHKPPAPLSQQLYLRHCHAWGPCYAHSFHPSSLP